MTHLSDEQLKMIGHFTALADELSTKIRTHGRAQQETVHRNPSASYLSGMIRACNEYRASGAEGDYGFVYRSYNVSGSDGPPHDPSEAAFHEGLVSGLALLIQSDEV